MTEAEWLAATDPAPILAFLRDRGGAGERKLRLFAVACCRRVWDWLSDERSQRAVRVAEWYAEQAVGSDVLLSAAADAETASREVCLDSRYDPYDSATWKAAYAAWRVCGDTPEEASGGAAGALACVTAAHTWDEGHPHESLDLLKAEDAERGVNCRFLRCLFGNPFRPAPSLAPSVLAWNSGTVPKLAAAIYEERAFDRLPVLADALEDAGCADADILGHCRGGGEHVRGCWVIDLVLGKG